MINKSGILYLLILPALVNFSISVFAQNRQVDPNRMLDWTLKEKFKVPVEKLSGIGKKYPAVFSFKSGHKAITDQLVSGGPEIEAELHAAINPADSNNLVVSPIQQDASAGISCPVYYTKNFGTTWNKSTWINMPYAPGMISGGGGDPVFAYDADGKLYFSWIDLYGTQMAFLFGTVNMGIFWAYSEDGGETWVKPQRDTILLGQMNMTFGQPSGIASPVSDKQWMAVDKSVSPFRNNLYVSYVSLAQNGSDATYQIMCKTKPASQDYFRSQAAAVTQVADFSFVQFASITTDHLGNIHITFYGSQTGNEPALWHSVSVDGGFTFSTPGKISDIRFNLPILQVAPYDTIQGINQQRTYPSPYLAGDPVNGNIYATWTAFGITGLSGNGADVYFSRSVDNGATWSSPLVVNDDTPGTGKHQYYSSICVDNKGIVTVSWYDRRNDPGNLQTHYFIAKSEDGGFSFGQNIQVTSAATDFSSVGSQNNGFGIGEYTQVVSTGYTTIPFWTDGRLNNGDMNVYCAFISPGSVGFGEIKNISGTMSISGIFPNPATEKISFTISLKDPGLISVYLADVAGKKLQILLHRQFQAGDHSETLSINNTAGGKYYLLFESENGKVVKSLVIR